MLPTLLSKHLAYPLWDLRDRSVRLLEMRRLQRHERENPVAKEARQWARIEEAVRYASEHCEAYRERGLRPVSSVEEFREIPILTKDDVRRCLAGLISNEYPLDRLSSAKTGGSTGVSLQLYFDKRCEERRNAAALWTNRWSGWDLGDPVGALWGNPPETHSWKARIRNACLDRRIFLDTVKLTEESMASFLGELARLRIRHLFGHAHSLYILARFAEASRTRVDVRGIVSTSMVLLPQERRKIEEVFRARVLNRYGCEEVGLIACECERHEGLHLNIDHLFVEVLRRDGRPAAPGEEGDIVLTDLINRGMPLIRYRVGDVGVLSGKPCACGRSLPVLETLTGRSADFLVTPRGALVAGVSLVERTLTAIPGVEQLQIIQEAIDDVVLNVVADSAYSPESEQTLLREMREALGEGVRFRVARITRIEQERNGKYRFAISKVQSAYQDLGTSGPETAAPATQRVHSNPSSEGSAPTSG